MHLLLNHVLRGNEPKCMLGVIVIWTCHQLANGKNAAGPTQKDSTGFIPASTGKFGRAWMLHPVYSQYRPSFVSQYTVQTIKATIWPI